jgi:hypothetical protein
MYRRRNRHLEDENLLLTAENIRLRALIGLPPPSPLPPPPVEPGVVEETVDDPTDKT